MEEKVWGLTAMGYVNIILMWWVLTFLTTLISWRIKTSVIMCNIVHFLIHKRQRGRRNRSCSTGGRASAWDSRPESRGGRYLTPNDHAKDIEWICTTATMRRRRRRRDPSLYDASHFSTPLRADRRGKTPDPSLWGVCQFLWPQHSHHWAGSVRTRGSLLWLQRPRPGGEGVVTTRTSAPGNQQPFHLEFGQTISLMMCVCFFVSPLQWNPGWSKAVA